MANEYKDRLAKLKEFRDATPHEKFGEDSDMAFLADAYRRLEKTLLMKETFQDRLAGELFASRPTSALDEDDHMISEHAKACYDAVDIFLAVRAERIKS